jgi:hypothetical protein
VKAADLTAAVTELALESEATDRYAGDEEKVSSA